jgi:hypothetical protein
VLAGDSTPNEEFGASVAIGDGYYVVGAPGNAVSKGAVFVFAGGTGAFLHKIVPADGLSGDRFGASLSIDAGLVAIGAPNNAAPSLNSGAVYIYNLATGALVKKVAPTYTSMQAFGWSVALAGNELYTSQDGTQLSGTVQTCGAIHQIRWDHDYTVVSHLANSIGGLCQNHLFNNLAYDGGTFLVGDGYFATGLVANSGNAFFGKRLPLALACDKKAAVATSSPDRPVGEALSVDRRERDYRDVLGGWLRLEHGIAVQQHVRRAVPIAARCAPPAGRALASLTACGCAASAVPLAPLTASGCAPRPSRSCRRRPALDRSRRRCSTRRRCTTQEVRRGNGACRLPGGIRRPE